MDERIFQYFRELLRQIKLRLRWIVLAVAVISLSILVDGMFYHPKYQTSMTIYADHKNVIQPLLKGQAPLTAPRTDRIRIVKEVIFSQRILRQVVNCCIDKSAGPNSDDMQRDMQELRDDVSISSPGQDYIQVSYSSTSPRQSYEVVNKITNLFIEQSAQNARTESKNAYDFIAQQVETYKDKLLSAEGKLKAFNAANTDGLESQVTASISRLQSDIEGEIVDVEALQVKIAALEGQLSTQNRYAASDYSAQVYRDRLAKLQAKLQTMLLNYKPDYPDVVDLESQIADLKKVIVQVENANQQDQPADLAAQQQLNPIYQKLSDQLSDAQVDLQTKKQRLTADKKRLQDQYARRKRVAANQAELSQLTRNYKVNKGIYDDLLDRKEKARISMTLNLAGQGLSYKILEPAVFPVIPTGLRFLHFAIAGPIFGLLIPLGVISALILLDPRIRYPDQINAVFPGIVLAVLPTRQKTNWWPALISFGILGTIYVSAALTYKLI